MTEQPHQPTPDAQDAHDSDRDDERVEDPEGTRADSTQTPGP